MSMLPDPRITIRIAKTGLIHAPFWQRAEAHPEALALIGLLPSGLGALVLAPRALFAVTNLRGSSLSRQDRHRRLIFAMLALGVWFLGILLSILALVHLL